MSKFLTVSNLVGYVCTPFSLFSWSLIWFSFSNHSRAQRGIATILKQSIHDICLGSLHQALYSPCWFRHIERRDLELSSLPLFFSPFLSFSPSFYSSSPSHDYDLGSMKLWLALMAELRPGAYGPVDIEDGEMKW
jgi:hypothetical protein